MAAFSTPAPWAATADGSSQRVIVRAGVTACEFERAPNRTDRRTTSCFKVDICHAFSWHDERTVMCPGTVDFDLLPDAERISLLFFGLDGAGIPQIPCVDFGAKANTERTR
jgi:hypothetical protein